jgi:23S rRNA pseudouridine1911/1915/1917 synthase
VDDPGALDGPTEALAWDQNRKVRRRVDTSLQVLHEDADAVAVFKPAGVLTHPTEAKEKDTLLSRVSGWLAKRGKGRPYVSVVHRLDKETSGVLVFALSRRGMVSLQEQLRAHAMDRRYLAIVEGDLHGESGVFRQDLVEDRGDRRRGVARPGEKGLAAVTDWKVLERFGIATLVEARLRTGRTHQVRVHFSAAGHPLVGDPVYRDPRRPPFPVPFSRQALHAARLGWDAPAGGKVLVEAPPPSDFQVLLRALRQRAALRPPLPRPSAPGEGSSRPVAPRSSAPRPAAPGPSAPRQAARQELPPRPGTPRPPAPRSGPRPPSGAPRTGRASPAKGRPEKPRRGPSSREGARGKPPRGVPPKR